MEIVIRAAVIFVFLWVVTRAVGRSTLGELSTFELLLYVTMGDLVQQAVTQQDYSVTSAVLAVGTFSLITILLSWINSRSRRLRPITHGTPVIIVDSGEPLIATMRRERISMDDLMAASRNNGIGRFGQIRLAVLETNGRISFFTDEAQSGATEPPATG
jgi:uncharacterized membrane protein YcaP (DUF421 family)